MRNNIQHIIIVICLVFMLLLNNTILAAERKIVSIVAEKSIPAIVKVQSRLYQKNRDTDKNEYIIGTGFIYSQDGYILTNHHVVSGARDITIILDNKKEYYAKIIGFDTLSDIALLKIDPAEGEILPFLTLAESDNIKPGEEVISIGHPLDFDQTISRKEGKDLFALSRYTCLYDLYEKYHEYLAPISRSCCMIKLHVSCNSLVTKTLVRFKIFKFDHNYIFLGFAFV